MSSETKYLSEHQRQLLGITPREFGGLPAMFQSTTFELRPAPQSKPRRRPLEERSLQLFQDAKAMREALERAHRLVARVNASIHSGRESSRSPMNEKYRAEQYRLDQEIATAMDSLRAASEALQDVEAYKRQAEKEAKEQRRHR